MQKRSIRKLELDMFELLKSEHIHFSCNILNRVYIELENVHLNVINMRTCCNSERIFTINCILLGLKRISRRVEAVNHICAACQWNGLCPHLGCLADCIPVYFAFQFQHVHLIKSGNGEGKGMSFFNLQKLYYSLHIFSQTKTLQHLISNFVFALTFPSFKFPWVWYRLVSKFGANSEQIAYFRHPPACVSSDLRWWQTNILTEIFNTVFPSFVPPPSARLRTRYIKLFRLYSPLNISCLIELETKAIRRFPKISGWFA